MREKKPFDQLDGLNQLVTEAGAELKGQGGRVFLRYSGTEPKARLLLEGRDADGLGEMVAENLRRDPETDRRMNFTGAVKISGRQLADALVRQTWVQRAGHMVSVPTWPSQNTTLAF